MSFQACAGAGGGWASSARICELGDNLNPFDNSLVVKAPSRLMALFSFFPNRIFFYSVS